MAGLEPVNAAADAAPGFVWRLKEDGGNATSFVIYDEPMILVNMSVWTDRQALLDFVYSDTHRALLRRRREFFTRMTQAYTVLWWVPAGRLPTRATRRRAAHRCRRQARQVPRARNSFQCSDLRNGRSLDERYSPMLLIWAHSTSSPQVPSECKSNH